ncbi:MAG: cell division protein FtsA [Acidobacteria bacterium]|nr:cell division protein FtsA [Acidobacteriota bacterium]
MSDKRLAVGLDVGSARVRCTVCLLEDTHLRYLGHGEAESHGWVKGRISDQIAVSAGIRLAVEEAERRSGAAVGAAVVGVGGTTVEGTNSRGIYEFGRPREIDPGDLGYAVELASKVRLEEGRLLLQVLPQDFTVDGRAGHRNPRGVCCSRVEANVHVITASAHDHHAVISSVHQAHLEVEETIFEPMASAYACILQEDRSRGVALVDIGAHSTDIAVYDGEALLRASSIPVCGELFTRDVAFGLTVSYEDAESLKKQYGCALAGLGAENSTIVVTPVDGRPRREAPRRVLNEILEARAEELFLFVRAELAKVGMEQALLEGAVLTGGGALLPGMCDMAERVLNCQARNGLASGIDRWPEEINDPSWATAAGLAMYSAKLKTQREWKRKVPSIVGMVLK